MQKFNKENLQANTKNQYFDDEVNAEQLKYPIDATSDVNLIENDSLDKTTESQKDVDSSVNTNINEENQSDAAVIDDNNFIHYPSFLNTMSSSIEADIESESSATKNAANIYDDDEPSIFEQNMLNTKFSEELSCEKKMFIEKNICKLRSRIEVDKSKLLGRGTYGDVYKCIDLETSEMMAVKILKKHKIKEFDELSFIKQHEIMQQIEHENIMKLMGHKKVDDTHWSFMEYCEDYISLSKLLGLLKEDDKQFTEDDCAYILKQVIEGLYTMHENNIMHRDIKADNVLVNINDFTVKLCDFDFVIQLPHHDSYVHGPMGTFSHMAPEMIRSERYTLSADVYSIGCLMLEILQNGNSPWTHANGEPMAEFQIAYQVGNNNKKPPFPSGLSESAIDFLNKCLESNPKERATAFDLLQHPFLNS